MTRDGHVKCTMLASLSKILKPLHGFDYGIFFFSNYLKLPFPHEKNSHLLVGFQRVLFLHRVQ